MARPPGNRFSRDTARGVFGTRQIDVTDPMVQGGAARGLAAQAPVSDVDISRRYSAPKPARPTSSITAQFHRAHGMSLPLQADGWPDIRDVEIVTDLPSDDRVNRPRGSAGYLPYVEKLTGAPAEYMQLLLGRESPQDTLGERNPNSSATGPGQMINATAVRLYRKYSKQLGGIGSSGQTRSDVLGIVRGDRRWMLALVGQYQIENAEHFRRSYQRNPTWKEMREMHFFGAGGDFHAFHGARDTDIAAPLVAPNVVGSNLMVFYHRYRDGMGKWRPDLSRPRTVAEVKQELHGQFPDREFDVLGAAPDDGTGRAQTMPTPWPPNVYDRPEVHGRNRPPFKAAARSEDDITLELNRAEAARIRAQDAGSPGSQ